MLGAWALPRGQRTPAARRAARRAGYGDLSPSILATRLMLFVMLVITLTLLPFMTGALMAALSASSPHQRAAYSPAQRGRHVVVAAGALSARRCAELVEELYAPGYGAGRQGARVWVGVRAGGLRRNANTAGPAR